MLEKRPFGTLADGTESLCWTLTNAAGLQAEILDCGVTIRSIVVPDQNGKPVDVVVPSVWRLSIIPTASIIRTGHLHSPGWRDV